MTEMIAPPTLPATPMNVATHGSRTLTAREISIQTLAVLQDAYRELNSKKLFWITMVLSGFVVAVFAVVGFDSAGFSILWKHFDHPFLNTTILPRAQLYKNLFIQLGVNWWLGYFAIILALVSTAPMFPDFLSGGAVDLYLARPLGRVRLCLTKYFVGLLFVSLQVLVFCTASYIVIGLRGGVWVPGLFLAVPVVVLLFSYLWSVCAFFGTLTRSTVAALLLTLLAWFGIFLVDQGETALLTFSLGTTVEARQLDADISRFKSEIADYTARPAATEPTSFAAKHVQNLTGSLAKSEKERAGVSDSFAVWHEAAYAVKWPLPKTSETTSLLSRWLDRQFRIGNRGRAATEPTDEAVNRGFFQNERTQRLTAAEVDKVIRSRSAAWVIGTSLLFEGIVLSLTAWIFSRRDY